MRPIIFKQAGKIALFRFNSDGTLSYAANTLVGANGTVESIQPQIAVQTADLPDGNADFPMGTYDTGKTGLLQVAMSSFQTNLYSALMGVVLAKETSKSLWNTDEEKTIPASGAYTVDLAFAPTGNIFVLDNAGSPFASVASGPAAGQFTVAQKVLTFNSVDASKQIFATYDHTVATLERVSLPTLGSRPTLHAIVSGICTSDDETAQYPFNVIVDRCKAADNLQPPSQQHTPQGWNFGLKVLKPRSGYNPVDFKYGSTAI